MKSLKSIILYLALALGIGVIAYFGFKQLRKPSDDQMLEQELAEEVEDMFESPEMQEAIELMGYLSEEQQLQMDAEVKQALGQFNLQEVQQKMMTNKDFIQAFEKLSQETEEKKLDQQTFITRYQELVKKHFPEVIKQQEEAQKKIKPIEEKYLALARKEKQRQSKIPQGKVTNIAKAEEFDVIVKNGKPTVVKFSAGWCMPCKLMGPLFNQVAYTYQKDVDFAEVDVDTPELKAIVTEHVKTGVPTFVFIDKKGKVLSSKTGRLNKETLETEIKKLV